MSLAYRISTNPGSPTDLPSTEFPRCIKLRAKREQMGLSQKDLAMLVAQHGGNVASNYISRFECGLQKPWKSAKTYLALALGVAESEIF